MTRFWMVARKPTSDAWSNPKMRHYSRDRAVAEAKRLANLTGETFAILGCEEVVVPEGAEAEALNDGSGPSMTPEQKAVLTPKRARAALAETEGE